MDFERCWLAAYTRSRHENVVANQLTTKGLKYLLPTYAKFTRWSDGVRCSEAPLFPGYVFVHVSPREHVPVLETAGVAYLVSRAGKPDVLADEEIEKLQACAARPGEIEPH